LFPRYGLKREAQSDEMDAKYGKLVVDNRQHGMGH
jgi:hypothetical protein